MERCDHKPPDSASLDRERYLEKRPNMLKLRVKVRSEPALGDMTRRVHGENHEQTCRRVRVVLPLARRPRRKLSV